MSQEHDPIKPDAAPEVDGIRPESAPFEPGYQPETLPHISVPDLADDAQGLSAEALAQVPTLTEWVDASAQDAPLEAVVAEAVVDAVADAFASLLAGLLPAWRAARLTLSDGLMPRL